jgi:hypothetical protein
MDPVIESKIQSYRAALEKEAALQREQDKSNLALLTAPKHDAVDFSTAATVPVFLIPSRETDVCLGRVARFEGEIFQRTIKQWAVRFGQATSKKGTVVNDVVQSLHSAKCRFLSFNQHEYQLVTDKKQIHRKVESSLRRYLQPAAELSKTREPTLKRHGCSQSRGDEPPPSKRSCWHEDELPSLTERESYGSISLIGEDDVAFHSIPVPQIDSGHEKGPDATLKGGTPQSFFNLLDDIDFWATEHDYLDSLDSANMNFVSPKSVPSAAFGDEWVDQLLGSSISSFEPTRSGARTTSELNILPPVSPTTAPPTFGRSTSDQVANPPAYPTSACHETISPTETPLVLPRSSNPIIYQPCLLVDSPVKLTAHTTCAVTPTMLPTPHQLGQMITPCRSTTWRQSMEEAGIPTGFVQAFRRRNSIPCAKPPGPNNPSVKTPAATQPNVLPDTYKPIAPEYESQGSANAASDTKPVASQTTTAGKKVWPCQQSLDNHASFDSQKAPSTAASSMLHPAEQTQQMPFLQTPPAAAASVVPTPPAIRRHRGPSPVSLQVLTKHRPAMLMPKHDQAFQDMLHGFMRLEEKSRILERENAGMLQRLLDLENSIERSSGSTPTEASTHGRMEQTEVLHEG